MSKAEPMKQAVRLLRYAEQNGSRRMFTPRQARRLRHKRNKALGRRGRSS